ncbi:P-loop containing nucleoside triphosphate hydrolase protein [Podospora aff. communis PSN243]|uniref:P-loop containing nucleoside triphosphate hydrolase protein n=1 Tax=Podospora aff. communis PSN243 TaxID=3040156 RepID=A0AAV9GDZ5_9PEZI|nr:P-loop containing nucleoside triphosphate hydrolase protein [Podospora aff. communis PSN243]
MRPFPKKRRPVTADHNSNNDDGDDISSASAEPVLAPFEPSADKIRILEGDLDDDDNDHDNHSAAGERDQDYPDAWSERLSQHSVNLDDITYVIVHRVACSRRSEGHRQHARSAMFFDHPRLNAGDCKLSPLHGKARFPGSLDDYLDSHPETAFSVMKHYDCEEYHRSLKDSFYRIPMPHLGQADKERGRLYYSVLSRPGPNATPESEIIEDISPQLRRTMRVLKDYDENVFSGWDLPQHLRAPYVHFYHVRDAVKQLTTDSTILDESARAYISLLFQYLETAFGKDYQDANALFERGMVTRKQLHKLFRANDIIVAVEDREPRGYRAVDCQLSTGVFPTVVVHCTTWSFGGQGTFEKADKVFVVNWPSDHYGDDTEEIPITSLLAYPLRYDRSGLRERLRKRGTMFWSCRGRRFVSYAAPRRTFEIRVVNPRYMIDLQTYKHLHDETTEQTGKRGGELDIHLMERDTPPGDDFVLQLPAKILGFGLHDKKWRYLLVENIQQINWNKAAFDRLVLDPDKKSLITAMVKEHVLSDVSADVIEGKGNGLIILLHGGPGTGKTLTAESVAELAEKPLYRVTCGDIGTDPEAVEKYLESVLYIGTIWKAVVLFDESDVFLEERSQADLQRNALVSVFLRVLEYYDGILILTSNRVGTFDEAFKSRVQLALHYPAIDEAGRAEIWLDFIQELEKQRANANFDVLRMKVGILAREDLNGRQIRNCIRTARQLASQAKEPLSYDHLKKAIKVAQEFEKYVVETHGGQTHEDFARAQNIRSS